MVTSATDRAEMDNTFQFLVRESLHMLLPATLIVAWLSTAYIVLVEPAHTIAAYLTFAVLALSTALCFWSRNRSVDLAAGVYLVGLILACTILMLTLPYPAIYYINVNVVLVTAMLTSTRTTWGVTTLLFVLICLIGAHRGLALPELLSPICMLLLAALTSWLSAQRLVTALQLALTMSRQGQRKTEEARAHRADLQRVMQSLDLAYTRLERANQRLIFAQEAAEQAYRFKADFVANVSHELRTPLNLIVGFGEMIATAPESYGGVTLPREYRGDIMAIYRNARHLLEMINDVLDLSQIEAGRMVVNKERLNLRDVIEEAVAMVHGLADAHGLAVRVRLPASMPALALDRTRMRQVLLNLLTNAMRHTEAGWVHVDVQIQNAVAWVFVEDSGCGIDPAKLHKAFEAFSRLDEELLRDGTGLGLAVSRKFVELHGGEMGIESELGRGTKVHFTLPLVDPDSQTLRSSPHLRTPLPTHDGQPVVLVLHEDRRCLDVLHRHIPGYLFVLATTPQAACEHIHHTLPNIILVDTRWQAQWPDEANRIAGDTAIPCLTCPLPSMHHLGQLMGATDYLPKPVMRSDLAAALARLTKPPQTALIIDDDPHVVRLIVRTLKAIMPELQVLEAYGGKEGLEIAFSRRPDIIFLDLVMPEFSGYSVIEAVRRRPDLAHTDIVVVSVRSMDQELAPILGDLRLQQAHGFTLTELLHVLQSLLSVLTRPDAVSPASAAAPLVTLTG